MPVTLNRTQCHSNNSFAFAPGAVEVIDLNLNSKGLAETLFLMSCLLCGSFSFVRKSTGSEAGAFLVSSHGHAPSDALAV